MGAAARAAGALLAAVLALGVSASGEAKPASIAAGDAPPAEFKSFLPVFLTHPKKEGMTEQDRAAAALDQYVAKYGVDVEAPAAAEAAAARAVPLPEQLPPALTGGGAAAEAEAREEEGPKDVHECHDEATLQRWHDRELLRITRVVPRQFQQMATELLEKDCLARLLQLRGGGAEALQPRPLPEAASAPTMLAARANVDEARAQVARPKVPPCLLDARACNSERELKAWRATKLAWIRDRLPVQAEAAAAVDSVRRDFDRRASELLLEASTRRRKQTEHEVAAEEPGTTAVVAAAEAEAPHANVNRLTETLGLAVLGLAAPALFAFLRSTCASPRQRHLSCDADAGTSGRCAPGPGYMYMEDGC